AGTLNLREVCPKRLLAGTEFVQRWIDMHQAPTRIVDGFGGVGDIGANLIEARVKAVHEVANALHAAAGVLIYDLGRVVGTQDIASKFINFTTDSVDTVAKSVRNGACAIGLGAEVLDVCADL